MFPIVRESAPLVLVLRLFLQFGLGRGFRLRQEGRRRCTLAEPGKCVEQQPQPEYLRHPNPTWQQKRVGP